MTGKSGLAFTLSATGSIADVVLWAIARLQMRMYASATFQRYIMHHRRQGFGIVVTACTECHCLVMTVQSGVAFTLMCIGSIADVVLEAIARLQMRMYASANFQRYNVSSL